MDGLTRAYHAMMAHLDLCLGDLLQTLENLGLADETAIVFSSDHGELLGHHGLLWKGPFLLDDLLRVPLLIHVPGGQSGPVEGQTSALDMMATLQCVAGIETPIPTRGQSLCSFEGAPLPHGARPYTLCEWDAPGDAPHASLRCFRTSQWKLVHYNHAANVGELYDLHNDPGESWNLWHEPRHAATRAHLEQQLAAHYLARRPLVSCEAPW